MEIYLITTNKNKVAEFKAVLEPEHNITQDSYDYLELRHDIPEEIVKQAAKQLVECYGKPICVEDSGFFIEALNDFPGTCTAYIHKRIGNKGFLKLMENKENRKIYYKSAIGFCEPNKEPVTFLGEEEGTIAEKETGTQGWGQDAIFIPKNQTQTYGELRKSGDVNIFRKKALEKFKEFLENKETKK
jgi:XTP/dITP diphosphohydrolase